MQEFPNVSSCTQSMRGVSWSEVATVPKRKEGFTLRLSASEKAELRYQSGLGAVNSLREHTRTFATLTKHLPLPQQHIACPPAFFFLPRFSDSSHRQFAGVQLLRLTHRFFLQKGVSRHCSTLCRHCYEHIHSVRAHALSTTNWKEQLQRL